MGRFTIKGLARANGSETLDAYGLAAQWDYWFTCNCNDRQCVGEYNLLREEQKREMLLTLAGDERYQRLLRHLLLLVRL